MKYKAFIIGLFILLFLPAAGYTQSGASDDGAAYRQSSETPVQVFLFGRDECKFCRAEKAFLASLREKRNDFEVVYLNIAEDGNAKRLFDEITTAKGISKVTPITVIGDTLIQGFDDERTTGTIIVAAIERAVERPPIDIASFAEFSEVSLAGSADASCSGEGVLASCSADATQFTFKLPFLGVVDLGAFSLFSLSVILGFVDGFNPCAMWVLVTFLLILLQIGDKRKMWQVVGLFLTAEAAMYFMILNVWYKTWDFIGLDMVVTPLIGLLALGGGVYFLWRFAKSKNTQACNIANDEYQKGIEAKIRKLVHSPLTVVTALGIVGIAFSVNVVEFACSVGIPQAFTKILEMNSLPFATHQLYILLYTFFYMIDDIVVFGFALWSFNKIHSSYKYAHYSSLIGGVLMIILGLLMLFAPDMLVF